MESELKEIMVWRAGAWSIGLSRDRWRVEGPDHVDYPRLDMDQGVVFQNPERIPGYVKVKVRYLMQKEDFIKVDLRSNELKQIEKAALELFQLVERYSLYNGLFSIGEIGALSNIYQKSRGYPPKTDWE